MLRVLAAVVFSMSVLLAGCQGTTVEPAPPTGPVVGAPAPQPAPAVPQPAPGTPTGAPAFTPRDAEQAGQLIAKGIGFIAQQAEQEQARVQSQTSALEAKVSSAQAQILAGHCDAAAVELVGIHWIPVTPGSNMDAEMVRQYDEKRHGLEALVERCRAAH